MAPQGQNRRKPAVTTRTKKPKSGGKQKKNNKKQATMQVPKMSMCARHYRATLVNPFRVTGACIPTGFPVIPSGRVRTFARGTFSTNTASNGAVLFNPFAAQAQIDYNSTSHKQWNPIIYTDGTGSAASWIASITDNVLPAGMVSTFCSSPYGSNTEDRKYRLVSAGLRVEYAGIMTNMGGQAVMTSVPSNGNAFFTGNGGSGELSFNALASVATNCVEKIGTGTYQCLYTPQFSESVNYFPSTVTASASGVTYSVGSASNLTGNSQYPLCLAIVLKSAAPSTSFRYEVVANYEIVGPASMGQAIPAHSDVQGMGHAIEQVQEATMPDGSLVTNSMVPASQMSMYERMVDNFGSVVGATASGMNDYFLSTAPLVGATVASSAMRRAMREL